MHVKCITIRTTATFKKHIHFRGEKKQLLQLLRTTNVHLHVRKWLLDQVKVYLKATVWETNHVAIKCL